MIVSGWHLAKRVRPVHGSARRRAAPIARKLYASALALALLHALAPLQAHAQSPTQDATQEDATTAAPKPPVEPAAVSATSDPASPVKPTPPSAPPSPAADPILAKPFAVLETLCARCHQAGRLELPAPAGGFGNVLDLTALARDPARVVPGVPDASPLFQIMAGRHMPPPPADERGGTGSPARAEPSPDDVMAVRDWIAGLPRRTAPCEGRTPFGPEQLAQAMRDSLARATVADLADTRFISLAALYNACASDAEMTAARYGVVKVLNAMSWQPRPVAFDAVGPGGALVVLRLSALGWLEAHWSRLVAADPYAGLAFTRAPEEIAQTMGVAAPLLRGDWLAEAVHEPGLYASMIGMPDTLDALERILGIAARDTAYAERRVARAATRTSRITRHNRLVEHHGLPIGSYWRLSDVSGVAPHQDVFRSPFDEGTRPEGAAGHHEPDAIRVLFNLPNAFPAFAVFDDDQRRLARVPAGIDRNVGPNAPGTLAGPACFACHETGPRGIADELAPALRAASGAVPSATERAAALLLHPDRAAFQRRADDATLRVRRAFGQAGIDPDVKLDGHEVVTGLARRHARPVDLVTASAETELSADDLIASIDRLTGDARAAGIQLVQATLSRPETIRLYHALMATVPSPSVPSPSVPSPPTPDSPSAPPQADAQNGPSPATAGPLKVTIATDRPAYAVGDLMTIEVWATSPCNLTLVSLDFVGKATVLLPNDYEQDNRIVPGRPLKVPGARAPYQFRHTKPGEETLVAICTVIAPIALGVEPDYERQLFTLLGDWRNHTYSALAEAAEARKSGADRSGPAARTSRGAQASRSASKPISAAARLSDTEARAAVTYRVR